MPVTSAKDRTFPGPWHVAEQGKSFRVLDATGFPVCHIYYDADATANWHPYLPSRQQALDLAKKIAQTPRLPEAMRTEGSPA